MIAVAGLLGVALAATDPDPDSEAYYVDASLDVAGELLSWRFVDIERDGAPELVLAVRTPAGERELRVHRMAQNRVEPEPEHSIAVLEDVLAWGLADVREEPGQELLFLTRAGIWSYSVTLSGYRDNVRPLARAELIYDLPDPRALPYWAYVIPGRERDAVLLPGRDALSLWGPNSAGDAYELRATLASEVLDEETIAREATEERDRGEGDDSSAARGRANRGSSPFLSSDLRADAALLSDSRGYRAPALVDLDGDGQLDLVTAREKELAVRVGGPHGPAAEPTRVEALPKELLDTDETSVSLRLVDVDGDGRLDVVGHVQDDIDGFENAQHTIYVYRAAEGRLLGESPDQVLRFEAALLRIEIIDVDGDGRADLAARKLELPSLVGAVTGIEFTFSHLVYLGERRAFARRPILKQDEKYDEESIVQIAANRRIARDCDGDGIADLVEVDLDGRIAIRRVRKESSLLRGESWTVDAAPWKRFESGGSIESLDVLDINEDGLGDIVSASDDRLVILLSARRRAK